MGLYWEVGTDGSVRGYGLHENLLLNGGMEVDQANSGSVYTNPSDGTETLDSWLVDKSGSTPPQADINRAARGDLGAQIDTGDYAMKVVVTNAGTVDAVFAMQQTLDYHNFLGITLSFSARIYSSLANTVRISIDDGISESFSLYHPGGSAYQTLSITKVISTSATYLKINVFKMIAGEVQIGSYFVDSAMLVAGLFSVPFRQKSVDYGIDGQRLTASSVKQSRINLASFAGSGIGFNQTGTAQVFHMASPPSGWTQVVTQNDRALRIVNDGSGTATGGSSSLFDNTFSLAHTHGTVAHTHGVSGIAAIGIRNSGYDNALIFSRSIPGGGFTSFGCPTPNNTANLQYSFGVNGVTPAGCGSNPGNVAVEGAGVTGSADSQAPNTNSQLGTYQFKYVNVIVASKN